MQKIIYILLSLFILSPSAIAESKAPTAVYGHSGPVIRLATGSPGDLGLVQKLAANYKYEHQVQIEWYRAGSGKALNMLREGQVDLVLVHAPAAEQQAVVDGWAGYRTLIGGNRYYLVGPADDPANVRATNGIYTALQSIAATQSLFFSRGDNSGTHKRELELWQAAGIQPQGKHWYQETKSFMEAGLRMANTALAYYLTDSSTWIPLQQQMFSLQVLLDGDPELINTYHALTAGDSPSKRSIDFIEFLVSSSGQEIISRFGIDEYGQSLYMNVNMINQ